MRKGVERRGLDPRQPSPPEGSAARGPEPAVLDLQGMQALPPFAVELPEEVQEHAAAAAQPAQFALQFGAALLGLGHRHHPPVA